MNKTTEPDNCCAPISNRMEAKGLILDKIAYMQHRIAELQTLHDMLPMQLTPQQDEAVFALVISLS